MPELPEVEVSRMGITPHVLNQVVTKVNIHNGSMRWPVPDDVYQLTGLTVTGVERRAKYLLLHCELGATILHLGMSGNLRVVSANEPLKKHDHIEFIFANGKALRLNDPRRFGCCLWQAPGSVHKLLAKLGPEPLTDEFFAKQVYQQSRNKKVPVKQFIMNNAIVVGVGNIYANESLFKAGIDPRREAGKVSLKSFEALIPIIKDTLAAAITQGGTTLKDFAQSDGKPGYFAQQLLVYGRKGQPCLVCKSELQEVRLGQRSTVFCGKCQK
ncbi:bifunctional DNA-formamidopyrimidine glycosylase/DNA-(apurinic or apyrimidinic site) lyase [Pseudoalteromonas sp. SG44-5]|uniref:bifunctional DNA-formamidopyrimidine glycosylase/DNA-(apurinic or apyrimidinic site) lyase n=1 Tax=unclassified Pseudoalteromonas TaxID=194690 RepID=UPI0015F94C43|nr:MULTISPECIES: bifunctional DNA-formamidopyrimidine glycosylase/DNA-(apurinic or apyrimidinic site) lyase [unclassified Pseudoalteromonas]MBB1406111.1 bifunctional DNA-formamidopyrimidine glycosylase/DNA-(apurinic or apyrimidinic site) lyase [Pseudoalteromonas sp. SG44-5]MBH0093697.1 bifunctional DNA-formamidopyrimidine glycosylase/DNA-(apurinic or apyrimidinic site) lyase [Pseudoalteromonas sp. SCQQ13]|tara:strand:+ start:321 stop:1130 length:810 start_codon:yes stop_codon:yes gene_type:complete